MEVPHQEQPQLHLVMTFGHQRNATRRRRRENVESPKLTKNAKKRVEFARYQDPNCFFANDNF